MVEKITKIVLAKQKFFKWNKN